MFPFDDVIMPLISMWNYNTDLNEKSFDEKSFLSLSIE